MNYTQEQYCQAELRMYSYNISVFQQINDCHTCAVVLSAAAGNKSHDPVLILPGFDYLLLREVTDTFSISAAFHWLLPLNKNCVWSLIIKLKLLVFDKQSHLLV